MHKIAFDNDLYIKLQSENIEKRIKQFDNKLYLEFGGKLFDDFHASRVLPGFLPDSKIKMLLNLKEHVEIIIVINASDIEKNKIRSDLGITYDQDLIRLIDAFRSIDLYVGSVVIAQYNNQLTVDSFKNKLEHLGIKVYLHYPIANYPNNVAFIVSEDGYGKNEYIETTKELVVVTAPGPGSGKMATCLSQLYHDYRKGIKAGYAKFETFPIWNLPLKHPVNLAYESATADLNDVNMIDPFHLEAYDEKAVSYNRDVEVFPVLNTLFEKILGESPYKSPTDMGVNMVGKCIINNEVAIEASHNEIIRRYYESLVDYRKDMGSLEVIDKIKVIMNQAGINQENRRVAVIANEKALKTDEPVVAIELNDGRLVTGKTSTLLGASSAALLNAIKILGGIDDEHHLISPDVIGPIQRLKTEVLGNNNPRLHTDEVLIALAIDASFNKVTAHALRQISKLTNCEVHSTVILSEIDTKTFKKLKMNLTQDPVYQSKRLYHKR